VIEQHISKNYNSDNSKPTTVLGGEKGQDLGRMTDDTDIPDMGAAKSRLGKKVKDAVKKAREKTKEGNYDEQVGDLNDIG
jgi:hypothetical protein